MIMPFLAKITKPVPFSGTLLQQSGSSSLAIRLCVVGGAVGTETTLPLVHTAADLSFRENGGEADHRRCWVSYHYRINCSLTIRVKVYHLHVFLSPASLTGRA